MIVRVLGSVGYIALPAASGEQAAQLCEVLPFDLVLLDLGMPKQDGWATLGAIRRYRPHLPVIIVTARSQQQDAAEAAGAAGCFEKPLDFPVILGAIARTLGSAPASVSTSRPQSF